MSAEVREARTKALAALVRLNRSRGSVRDVLTGSHGFAQLAGR